MSAVVDAAGDFDAAKAAVYVANRLLAGEMMLSCLGRTEGVPSIAVAMLVPGAGPVRRERFTEYLSESAGVLRAWADDLESFGRTVGGGE